MLSPRGDFHAHPPATDDPAEIGPVDVVFLGLKAYSYAGCGPLLAPLPARRDRGGRGPERRPVVVLPPATAGRSTAGASRPSTAAARRARRSRPSARSAASSTARPSSRRPASCATSRARASRSASPTAARSARCLRALARRWSPAASRCPVEAEPPRRDLDQAARQRDLQPAQRAHARHARGDLPQPGDARARPRGDGGVPRDRARARRAPADRDRAPHRRRRDASASTAPRRCRISRPASALELDALIVAVVELAELTGTPAPTLRRARGREHAAGREPRARLVGGVAIVALDAARIDELRELWLATARRAPRGRDRAVAARRRALVEPAARRLPRVARGRHGVRARRRARGPARGLRRHPRPRGPGQHVRPRPAPRARSGRSRSRRRSAGAASASLLLDAVDRRARAPRHRAPRDRRDGRKRGRAAAVRAPGARARRDPAAPARPAARRRSLQGMLQPIVAQFTSRGIPAAESESALIDLGEALGFTSMPVVAFGDLAPQDTLPLYLPELLAASREAVAAGHAGRAHERVHARAAGARGGARAAPRRGARVDRRARRPQHARDDAERLHRRHAVRRAARLVLRRLAPPGRASSRRCPRSAPCSSAAAISTPASARTSTARTCTRPTMRPGRSRRCRRTPRSTCTSTRTCSTRA